MALPETVSEYKTRTDFDRMSDLDKLERMTAELETVSNAFLLTAQELYSYDSGESERVTALIYSLGLMAADFDRRRSDLLEVVNRIAAARLKEGRA